MAERMITLRSTDGETFVITEAVAVQSQIIKHMIEDGFTENGIPVPNVTGNILAKVIEYCKRHVEAAGKTDDQTVEELKTFDSEFVAVDPATTLLDLVCAANYLNIKSLSDLTCDTVVNIIKGKTPEELRETFNIENDFTPEEEEEVRRENAWAFDALQ